MRKKTCLKCMMILILVIVWFEKLRHLIRVQKNREQYDEILNEVDEVLSKFM